MRFLQYIILLILVLNGLQPLLTEGGSELVVETQTEELCSSTESSDCQEQGEDDNIENSGDEDLITSDDSQVIEPKPNDLQPSSAKGKCGAPEFYQPVDLGLTDWAITTEHKAAKIPLALKRHSHFSKRAADAVVLAS